MNRSKLFFLGLLAISMVSFTSCFEKDSVTTTATIVQSNDWRVTHYSEDVTDDTQDFAGYTFTFEANGTASATDGTTTVTGTWSTGIDDSQNKLILTYQPTGHFDSISEDWEILEKSTSIIRLQHTSGGSGTTELLTFEKI